MTTHIDSTCPGLADCVCGGNTVIDKPNMFERLFARAVKFSPDIVAAIITIFIGKLNALRSKVESGKAE